MEKLSSFSPRLKSPLKLCRLPAFVYRPRRLPALCWVSSVLWMSCGMSAGQSTDNLRTVTWNVPCNVRILSHGCIEKQRKYVPVCAYCTSGMQTEQGIDQKTAKARKACKIKGFPGLYPLSYGMSTGQSYGQSCGMSAENPDITVTVTVTVTVTIYL